MLSKKVVIFELKNCFYIQLLLSFSRFCTKIWQSKTEKGGHQNDVPTFFMVLFPIYLTNCFCPLMM